MTSCIRSMRKVDKKATPLFPVSTAPTPAASNHISQLSPTSFHQDTELEDWNYIKLEKKQTHR